MFVQRVAPPGRRVESWTVLGADDAPVEPIERYLSYLSAIERSPNTVKAYAHDLKDFFCFLDSRGLDWREVRLEDLGEYVAWLRLPPAGRSGQVSVLPAVEPHVSARTINRKLSALASFYQHQARHGVDLGDLLTAWAGPGGGRSFKPFLHHIGKTVIGDIHPCLSLGRPDDSCQPMAARGSTAGESASSTPDGQIRYVIDILQGVTVSRLLTSYEDRILLLTIDNPPLNVITQDTWEELGRRIDEAERRDIRGIIVTSTGDQAFCAGSNIREMVQLDEASGTAWSRRNYAIRERVRQFRWPVVAAINGMALGGGLALALACDVRVAVRTASFGLPEAKVGLVGTANHLLRYLPPGKVKELVFTGRRLSAEEAHAYGLVEQIVPEGEALTTAFHLLRESFEMSSLAIRLYKTTINQGMDLALEAASTLELDRLQECWASEERRDWVQRYWTAQEAKRIRAQREAND